MALQIASFNISRTPINQFETISGGNNEFIIPTTKNILLKKISSNCTFIGSSSVVVNNYTIFFELLNRDRTSYQNNNLIINSFTGFGNSFSTVELNKNNPIKKLNIKIGGLRLLSSPNYSNSFTLNSNILAPNDLINFKISLYYVEVE